MIYPTILLPATTNNMTGSTTLHSVALDMRSWTAGTLAMIWTGTPTGTFTIEGSPDNLLNASPLWIDISGLLSVTLSQPAGAAGNNVIDIGRTGLPWVRITYVNSGSTGTLQVVGNAKGY